MLYKDKLLNDLRIVERKLSSKGEEVPKEISNMASLCEKNDFSSVEFKTVADLCYKKLIELAKGGYLYFPNAVQRGHFLGLFQNRAKVVYKCKIVAEDFNVSLPSANKRAHFVNKWKVLKLGVLNAEQRKSESVKPFFGAANGYYYAIEIDKKVYAVVPVFGYSIGPLLYGIHAMKDVFEFSEFKEGKTYSLKKVEMCALFESDGKDWSIINKGSLVVGESKREVGRAEKPAGLKVTFDLHIAVYHKPMNLQEGVYMGDTIYPGYRLENSEGPIEKIEIVDTDSKGNKRKFDGYPGSLNELSDKNNMRHGAACFSCLTPGKSKLEIYIKEISGREARGSIEYTVKNRESYSAVILTPKNCHPKNTIMIVGMMHSEGSSVTFGGKKGSDHIMLEDSSVPNYHQCCLQLDGWNYDNGLYTISNEETSGFILKVNNQVVERGAKSVLKDNDELRIHEYTFNVRIEKRHFNDLSDYYKHFPHKLKLD
ncbi:MAG TPA: hypothetical protein VI564_02325 [Candidatus Nanoarchaeia archaeon]|nr:hypothetical protein [Candidatus Nanoarchaeia archaeon]